MMNDTTFQGNGKVAYVPVVVNAKPPKPTNYDRLRAKSVEEMAEFLADVVNDAVDKGLYVKGFLDTRYKTSLWIEWLKMKCEEAKDFESWRLSEE